MLNACIEPLHLDDFFNDDTVIDAIERDRVGLDDKTSDGLHRGNQRILGLKPDKYYMVEVHDEDKNFLLVTYVKTSGELAEETGDLTTLEQIGMVSTGVIIGLNNAYTYTVYDAKPLTGTMKRYDISNPDDLNADPPPAGHNITAGNSGITVNTPTNFHFLDLSSQTNNDNTYDVLRLPVSDDDNRVLLTLGTDRLLRLSRAYKETDYIIVEYEGTEIKSFRVLRVTISGDLKEDGLLVLIRLNLTDGSAQFSHNDISISQVKLIGGTVTEMPTITVSNSSDFITGSINWYYYNNFNDDEMHTGETLDLNSIFTDEYYWKMGIHLFTVIAVLEENSRPYSASFAVTVTQ